MTQEQLTKVSGVFPPVPYRDTNVEPLVLAWMQRRSRQRHLIFPWISFWVRMVCSLLNAEPRDPLRIARDLGIEVMYYPFNEQRGAYKVLMRNRFIFVKNDLHPVMENIVLLHELGHDALHRE